MQPKRKTLTAALVLMLMILAASSVVAQAQESQSRLATASGNGTLRVGREQFKVTFVIVKLLDDHKAEVTLVSDITVFVSGTWSSDAEHPQWIGLEITGGAAPGGLEGTGKLFLSADSKSVARLTIKGVNRNTSRGIQLDFEGK